MNYSIPLRQRPMACRLATPPLAIVVALLTPTSAFAHADTVTVEAWSTVASAATYTGPVTKLNVRFNALRYGSPATTVVVAIKDPPDIPSVISALPGIRLWSTPNFLNVGLDRTNLQTRPKRPHDACDPAGLSTQSAFRAFLDAATDAAQCFNREAKPFDQASKYIRKDLDAYKKLAIWADDYLGGASPASRSATSDQKIDTLVACAHELARDVGSSMGVSSAASGGPCPFPGMPPSGASKIPDPGAASKDLKVLAGNMADDKDTLDEAFGLGKLTSAQRDVLAARFGAIPIGAYVDDGPALAVYTSNFGILHGAVGQLAATKPEDFVYWDTISGLCSPNENGEKRTVSVELRDRFAKPDAEPIKKDVAVVDCLSRNATSAGAGYTGLKATTYQLQQQFANAMTTSQIARSNDNPQFAAAVLAHRCLCRRPNGDLDGFATFGVLTAGKSPIGLFGGYSARFGQRYFVSFGGSYGTEATLLNGTVGQTVPNDFKVATGTSVHLRPAILISVGK